MVSAKKSSSLLIDEQPLQVIPSLAVHLGVNAAILLQQINYWIKHAERSKDERKFKAGRWWTYNSYSDWQHQMPWMSESGIRKLVKKLEDESYIKTVKHRRSTRDHTKWYTILYENVNTLGHIEVSESDTSKRPGVTDVDVSESDRSFTESPEALSDISTEGGASAQSVDEERIESLANHTMKAIYQAMKDARFTITGKDYGQQVARVQWALDNMDPSDAELEDLPTAYVRAYKIRGAATDAVYALNELRRQGAREEVLNESSAQEQPHPQGAEAEAARDKPRIANWYAAFHPDTDVGVVERWIREGATHTQILARLEGHEAGAA